LQHRRSTKPTPATVFIEEAHEFLSEQRIKQMPVLFQQVASIGRRGRKRWLPYEKGSRGHESAEPISFDVAGDYIFVAYTRGLKADGIKYAFVKVFKLADGSPMGNLVAEKELGEIGLLDIVDSVRAVQRANGEYVVFLEDDAKAKVVMFRWQP
jgi:hypothetical protein